MSPKKSPVEALVVAVPETAGSALYGMVDVLSAAGTLAELGSCRIAETFPGARGKGNHLGFFGSNSVRNSTLTPPLYRGEEAA